MIWLEEQALRHTVSALLGHYGRCPETFTITILHLGGYYPNSPLRFTDRWLQNILQWPALPRLREFRLELEIPEKNIHDLRVIVQDLREKYQLVERVDHFGDLGKVELQESPPEWTWFGWKVEGRGIPAPGALEKHDYRVVTLVWKVSSTSSATNTVRSSPVFDEDTVDLTHRMGSNLPVLAIGNPDQISNGFLNSKSMTEASPNDHRKFLLDDIVQKYEDRWQKEGSLLKFAQTVPDF